MSSGVHNPKTGEVPTVSKTLMLPDPGKTRERLVSSTSSIFSDVSVENGDSAHLHRSLKRSKLQRRRKRLSTLLHTHVMLIVVCSLSALDAACVVGQIICDVLLMKESIEGWEDLDSNLTSLLWEELPGVLNSSEHQSPDSLDLRDIAAILWEKQQLSSEGSRGDDMPEPSQDSAESGHRLVTGETTLLKGNHPPPLLPASSRQKRETGGGEEKGGVKGSLLYDLTHYFHLGSMIILSALLLECFLKVFAMGRKLLHHKLEMFDIFVVTVSWALDVAFWEGIWAHPETEAATILIVMLPWRVVRIVNSFVLVIQEKDHVTLKIVKQRLRLSAKKGKEVLKKASGYKAEVKQLQSLCRRYGATDTELMSCIPADRRRRSSLGGIFLKSSSTRLLHNDSSLSLSPSTLNTLSSLDIDTLRDSSSSSEDENDVSTSHDVISDRDITCNGRQEPGCVPCSEASSGVNSFSALDDMFVEEGDVGEGGQAKGGVSSGMGTAHGAVSKQDSLTRL